MQYDRTASKVDSPCMKNIAYTNVSYQHTITVHMICGITLLLAILEFCSATYTKKCTYFWTNVMQQNIPSLSFDDLNFVSTASRLILFTVQSLKTKVFQSCLIIFIPGSRPLLAV